MQFSSLLAARLALGRLSLQAKTTALLAAVCCLVIGLAAVDLSQVLAGYGADLAYHLTGGITLFGLIGLLGLALVGQGRSRQRTEAELRASEARYRLLAEHSSDAIMRTGLDGTRHYVSPAVRRILGRSPEEIIAGGFSDFVHPDDRAAVVASFATLRQGAREEEAVSFRWEHKDGSHIWVECISRLARDRETGQPIEIIASLRDITERKRSEERFRRTVEAAPSAMLMVNASGRIEMANEQTERVFGYPRAELIGQPMEILLPERYRGHHPALRQAFARDPRPRGMAGGRELFGRRKDGSEFSVEVVLSSIEIEEGAMVLSAMVDITERKQAEAALRESETRYRLLAEHSSDAIMRIGLDGTRHYVSPAVRRILGRSPEELLAGGAFGELVHADDRAAVVEALAAVRAGTPAPAVISFRWRHHDGHYVWIEAVSSLVRDEGTGAPLEVISTLRDVTTRKAAEAALLAAERRLEDAIASISDAFVLFDRDDRLVMANQRYLDLYPDLVAVVRPGATYEAIARAVAHSGARVLPGEDTERNVLEALDWHRRASDVIEYQLKDGRWIMGSERRTSDGGTVGVRTDITMRKSAELLLEENNRQLQQLSRQDGLTGLANRRCLDELLDTEFQRARRDAAILSLVMIDVDLFKKFNDRYGHPAGDECLKAVAAAVRDALRRPGDIAARYGGEEFVVLLPNTPEAGALSIAEKIRQAVRSLEIKHEASPLGILTISLGVSSLCPVRDVHCLEDLLQAADQALYAAKAGGRDRVCAAAEFSRDNIRSLRR